MREIGYSSQGGSGIYDATSPTVFFAGMLSGPGLRSAVVFVPFSGSSTDLLGFGLTPLDPNVGNANAIASCGLVNTGIKASPDNFGLGKEA